MAEFMKETLSTCRHGYVFRTH